MALIIAGERSGVGKTTITLMILAALRRSPVGRAHWADMAEPAVQSFKVGPDYIDPMFHSYVTNRPCYNLDPVLTSEWAVQRCFNRHQQADYALVEGVMGLFDGTVWTAPGPKPWSDNAEFDQPQASAFASTAHVAKLLDLPVLLVIDCSRLSGSVAAIAQGYATLDPAVCIAGLVLNRVGSDRHLTLLKSALEPLDIPILGVLRRHKDIELPDRHLGLVPTDELPELEQRLDRLAAIGAEAFDWEQLLPMLRVGVEEARGIPPSPPLEGGDLRQEAEQNAEAEILQRSPNRSIHPPFPRGGRGGSLLPLPAKQNLRIGIARDRAFNFYYAENLELLEQAGAELVFWSPLDDAELPPNLQGLIFGGGFPEIFAEQLSANGAVLAGVRQAIAAGALTYAECGGLMYLCQALRDLKGQNWPMVGVLPAIAVMDRLTLGYRRAVVQRSTPLLDAGATVWGHEFHHSRLERSPEAATAHSPLFELWGNDLAGGCSEGFVQDNVHGSYLHLHWGGQHVQSPTSQTLNSSAHIPQRFVAQIRRFSAVAKI